MEQRAVTSYVTFQEMEKYLKDKGYIIKSGIEVLKEDLKYEKDSLDTLKTRFGKKAFSYKFAYLPKEYDMFLWEMKNIIEEKLGGKDPNPYTGKWFWFNYAFNNNERPHLNTFGEYYMLDEKARTLMKEEFLKYVLNGESREF